MDSYSVVERNGVTIHVYAPTRMMRMTLSDKVMDLLRSMDK